MAGKVCKACHTEKQMNEFPSCLGHPEWIMSICKDCKRMKDNEYSRRRNERDREKVNARNAAWASENREQDLERKRKYNREHKDECLEWHREKRRTDVKFRLTGVLRCRLRMALKGLTKSASTMEMLGCSTEELKRHLELRWRDGMTWENYGGKYGWQIDHIIPCASFDLTREEEQRKCFHFSNLQPLWAVDNRAKGTKLAA